MNTVPFSFLAFVGSILPFALFTLLQATPADGSRVGIGEQSLQIEISDSWWWVTPAFSIVGVVIGAFGAYFLGERSARNRAHEAESRLRDSVRKLLTVELDNNLSSIDSFWKKVAEPTSSSDNTQQSSIIGTAGRFSKRPLPVWRQLMWESQSPHLATALSENEIGAVQQLQANAQSLVTHHQTLRQIATDDHLRPRTEEVDFVVRRTIMPVPEKFPHVAKALWPEIEKLVETLARSENPLRARASNEPPER